MALLSLQNVSMGYGGPPLLDGVNFQIEEGERVCLVGRNGTGKSTLMKIINGEIDPDRGEIIRQNQLRVAYLMQDVPINISGTVFDLTVSDLPGDIQWEERHRIERILSQMDLDGDVPFETLSAGKKRRVLLAKGLASDPHLLLLDEPTNHLDIDSVKWLEDFLIRYGGTLLFVTHDRVFLQKLATRIVELDRGRLSSWECDYQTYLVRSEERLSAESKEQAKFDKRLTEEEAWLRQGVKARRTRNEGRVRALKAMRDERRARRELSGSANITIQNIERSGKLVVEASEISCGYENSILIRDFSTLIMRGDKIGIIGPNGVGKTTLVKTLLGELPPASGKIKMGTNLQIAYFDQLREQLDDNKSVQENVAEGSSNVVINGKSRHIIGYLQDFLFSPDRARTPVKALSGGERNRLLLAKLFTRPSNVIVMDEPTNDLDIETLNLLEDLLVEYAGTILLISHDRAFINNIVTSTLVFEGDGKVGEYIGGYDDWLRQKKPETKVIGKEKEKITEGEKIAATPRPRKLTNKENRELGELPKLIEKLESEKERLSQLLANPETYKKGTELSIASKQEFEEIENRLKDAYSRWEELEKVKSS